MDKAWLWLVAASAWCYLVKWQWLFTDVAEWNVSASNVFVTSDSTIPWLTNVNLVLDVFANFMLLYKSVGDWAFTVAGSRVWNTLPEEITTSQTLSTFRQQLKTWLFRKSYPDIIIWTFLIQTINLEVALLHRQSLIDWLIDWLIVLKVFDPCLFTVWSLSFCFFLYIVITQFKVAQNSPTVLW